MGLGDALKIIQAGGDVLAPGLPPDPEEERFEARTDPITDAILADPGLDSVSRYLIRKERDDNIRRQRLEFNLGKLQRDKERA